MAYDVKIKSYYDGRAVYQIARNPIRGIKGRKIKEKRIQVDSEGENEQNNIDRSMRRIKEQIYNAVHNNPWEFFMTVTFNGEKVDRYNWEEIRKKHAKMLNNLKQRKCPNLQYIFVPELHKDGAIHFHALVMGLDGLTLLNSGKKDKYKRVIYNVSEFNLGFNTLTRIADPSKAGTYITKYITKDMYTGLKGKRYWISRGLNELNVTKVLVGLSLDKEKLVEDLLNDDSFAGYHSKKIETDEYSNSFTYIVTHPGANGHENRVKNFASRS